MCKGGCKGLGNCCRCGVEREREGRNDVQRREEDVEIGDLGGGVAVKISSSSLLVYVETCGDVGCTHCSIQEQEERK